MWTMSEWTKWESRLSKPEWDTHLVEWAPVDMNKKFVFASLIFFV